MSRPKLTMDDRDGLIWLDGEMVPWREAKVHVLTHTLHYGMGVFEGVRAYETDQGAAIFRLQDHTRRLFNSAKILAMQVPFDEATLNEATRAVVRENDLSSAYIRPMCFLGAESMGLHAEALNVHVMIAAWPWGAYLGEEKLAQGLKVMVSSFTRHHVNVTMCRAKANGNYLNSMMASNEARRCGHDEALLLDAQGYVAEGSGENIFIVRDGVLHTPPITSALDGITRQTIFTLAAEAGIEVRESTLTRDQVYVADEAFFTGTAAEVTPIAEVDGRVIGCGRRGPLTERLQARYFAVVKGQATEYADWLTHVA